MNGWAVRCFHAAILLETEWGHLQWGDSFHYLEQHSFHDQLKRIVKQKSPQTTRATPVLFCHDYQRGKCRHEKDHFGTIRGTKKWLQQICAKCLITARSMEQHQEFSSSCPSGDSAQESKPISPTSNWLPDYEQILCNNVLESLCSVIQDLHSVNYIVCHEFLFEFAVHKVFCVFSSRDFHIILFSFAMKFLFLPLCVTV